MIRQPVSRSQEHTPASRHTPDLDAAYALCRQINAHHGKSYYFSALFFPPHVRRSVHALYGFVRYPDEIVDNPPPGSNPAASLENYREATLDALNAGVSDLPVLRAFADMARRHSLPPEYSFAGGYVVVLHDE